MNKHTNLTIVKRPKKTHRDRGTEIGSVLVILLACVVIGGGIYFVRQNLNGGKNTTQKVQKPQAALIALGWTVKQDGNFIKDMNPMTAQLLTLAVFLLFLWIASRGITSLKVIGTIAGTSVFVMSLLYVVLMLAAPAIRGIQPATVDFSIKKLVPNFNFSYFTTLSMLIFAVGGSEKISPYVNNMKKPSKDFPKGMIALATMVAISALLGSIAMSMMFDANNIPSDLKMNGQYYAFQILGEYYGVDKLFIVIYALANLLAQISALVFSIDAPLKVLLADGDKNFIPKALTKTNKYGAPINGYIMTAVLVGILIIVPALGIGDMNSLFDWLLQLNSVVMPMRYLWVFLAFIGLKKAADKYKSEYKFVKNDKFAMIIGIWCFVFTAFACIMGMFPNNIEAFSGQWWFQVSLNVVTPFILIGLGFILPIIAKKTNNINRTNKKKAA